MKLYEDFNRKDFNNEDLKDEGLEELEELERLEAEGKLKIKEWIIGNRKFNEISNDDIKETLNLFSDNLKIKLKDFDFGPEEMIKHLIDISIGNLFGMEYDNLTKEENKIKSIEKFEEIFGKELSNKLRQLNDKYGYYKPEEE